MLAGAHRYLLNDHSDISKSSKGRQGTYLSIVYINVMS